jgi:hypothetical protein
MKSMLPDILVPAAGFPIDMIKNGTKNEKKRM